MLIVFLLLQYISTRRSCICYCFHTHPFTLEMEVTEQEITLSFSINDLA